MIEFHEYSVVFAALYLRGGPASGLVAGGLPRASGAPEVERALRRHGLAAGELGSVPRVLREAGMWVEAAVLESAGVLAAAEALVLAGRVMTPFLAGGAGYLWPWGGFAGCSLGAGACSSLGSGGGSGGSSSGSSFGGSSGAASGGFGSGAGAAPAAPRSSLSAGWGEASGTAGPPALWMEGEWARPLAEGGAGLPSLVGPAVVVGSRWLPSDRLSEGCSERSSAGFAEAAAEMRSGGAFAGAFEGACAGASGDASLGAFVSACGGASGDAFEDGGLPSGGPLRLCYEVGAEVRASGWLLSGGAPGCDAAALEGAAERAIALLPCGLEASRSGFFARGALSLSVCAPGSPFSAAQAMERNALLFRAARWALVGHSRFRLGGTWAGVSEALRVGACPVFVAGAGGPSGPVSAGAGGAPGSFPGGSFSGEAFYEGAFSGGASGGSFAGEAAGEAALGAAVPFCPEHALARRALLSLGARPFVSVAACDALAAEIACGLASVRAHQLSLAFGPPGPALGSA
ncbi:MAG: hypothetical protein JST35_06345 [Armatimonadetes bacterium]|nr:hypothetical protein [Armatimonadota bacterium]